MIRTFKWVRIAKLDDWLSCGWIVSVPNAPMHHHLYSLLCEWLCDCKIVMPDNHQDHYGATLDAVRGEMAHG
jgi:hypothetical protein